jgi:hypothetical protein
MTEDVVQVLSQLRPIMQQLAGVDLQSFLQDISKLPGAVGNNLTKKLAKPSETDSSGE